MIAFERTKKGLQVSGELTIFHAAEARFRLREELEGAKGLEVDLSQVTELDTAGAQVLLWLKREARAQGRSVPFVHHSAAVVEVLDLLNLAGALGDTLVLSPNS